MTDRPALEGAEEFVRRFDDDTAAALSEADVAYLWLLQSRIEADRAAVRADERATVLRECWAECESRYNSCWAHNDPGGPGAYKDAAEAIRALPGWKGDDE